MASRFVITAQPFVYAHKLYSPSDFQRVLLRTPVVPVMRRGTGLLTNLSTTRCEAPAG